MGTLATLGGTRGYSHHSWGYSGVPRALWGVLVGTHRMPSIHPDQLKAEAAEAAELLKKLKACMNPEHNPSR